MGNKLERTWFATFVSSFLSGRQRTSKMFQVKSNRSIEMRRNPFLLISDKTSPFQFSCLVVIQTCHFFTFSSQIDYFREKLCSFRTNNEKVISSNSNFRFHSCLTLDISQNRFLFIVLYMYFIVVYISSTIIPGILSSFLRKCDSVQI